MVLSPGARLGPYEILASLGSGGMGEVYRAKDGRLDRTVAIKILREHVDPTRRRRFEREARAVSRLSHPHICALYDVGEQDNVHFIVMEYLEGETLADRLRRGRLPVNHALRYAIDIADALDHAHRQGIVHRDLKPANIMLTRSGAKLLDFGVARLQPVEVIAGGGSLTAEGTQTQSLTEEGTVLGTLLYMAPEQVEGRDTDARTDIFSLGAVVYEMTTGRTAFEGASKASLIAAILEHDVPPLSLARSQSGSATASAEGVTPPLLDQVVSRCLAKDPDERWQTAADLQQALKWILEGTSQIDVPVQSSTRGGWHREHLAWLASAVSIVIAVVSYFTFRSEPTNVQPVGSPTFKRLTFRRGFMTAARFAPDGQTVIYSSAWDGGPVQLYETRTSGPESRSLGLREVGLASISSSNELALLSGCRLSFGYCIGTLARMPVSGGAPRELLEDVTGADFTPDGRELAALHFAQGEYRLEFPIGQTLYKTAAGLGGLTFSPRGDRLAFIEHPILADESGVLKVVDLKGRAATVSGNWRTIRGISWSPSGDEILITGSQTGKECSVYAVSLSGQVRLIFHAPGDLTLWDVSREGRLLVSASSSPARGRMIWTSAGEERELSWLDWSTVADLSADGRDVLFHEWGVGVGATPVVYVRKVDGSDAVRLGDGKALALSPDGRWALAVLERAQPQLVLLPTGVGQSRVLPTEGLSDVYWAKWFPDGRRLLLAAAGSDSRPRSYIQDVETGTRTRVAEDGILAMLVSPDGQRLLALDPLAGYSLWPVDGAKPVRVEGLDLSDRPFQWSADGRYLYLRDDDEKALRVYRLTMATGRRELWQTLAPRDPTGVFGIATGRGEMAITPDGKSAVYTYWVGLEDLFLVEGVRQ